MGYVTGEVEAREQAPWAYDAVNDLLKQGPLYMAAAGLTRGIRYTNNNLAGFTQPTAGGSTFLVPSGRTLLITDLTACVADAAGKQVVVELLAGGGSIAPGIVTPLNGGSVQRTYTTPLIVPAGQTLAFQLNPLGGAAAFVSVRADGVLL